MKRMKYILAVFILGISIQLTACGTKDKPVDQEQGGEYRMELTDEELQGGHVSFQMDENLVVDADVTAKEKYEKGLSSYYLKIFCETDKEAEKKFLEAPTLSLHSFGEWEEMLNRIVPGEFKDNKFKINKKDADIRQSYKGEKNKLYLFQVNWSNYTKGVAEKTGFNAPVVMVNMGRMGDGITLSNRARSVRKYVRDYHGSSKAGFLQEAGEDIGQMKAFLQEAAGRLVYEEYDFSVVNKETIGMLNKACSWTEEESEEEYAAFYFYYDIDGLPFKDLKLNYIMENDDTADELCYWSSMPGNNLQGFSEHKQELIIGTDGVMYLEFSNGWDAGEVYKERLSVVTPNEALKQVKEHYERQLVKEECVVTDIRLVYTGYFSDGADGKIRPVVSPFWEMEVYDGDERRYVYFVYDAYTGECVREGM